MSESPQTLIAIASFIVVFTLAVVGIRREWTVYQRGGLNAVTFAWAGLAYFVGVGALVASATRNVDLYSVGTSLLALLAVSAGVLGMSLGASSSLAFRIAGRLPQGPEALSRGEAYSICVSLIAIALLVRYLAYGSQFILGSLTRALPASWGNYVFDLRHAVVPGGIMAVHILVSYRTSIAERLVLLGLLLITVLISFLEFSRRPLVLFALGSLVYWINRKGIGSDALRKRGLLLVAGSLVLFVVALLGAAVRWLTLQVSGIPLGWSTLGMVLRRLTATAVSLDAYSVHLACVRWYQQPGDWLLGGSLVQVITNPIPRVLWAGKPETFGFTIAKLMGDYTTNYGPTIFGEGFANLGLLGSAAFGWLLGFGARVAQQYQHRSRTDLSLMLAAMASFEFFAQVRGDMQGITTPMLERAGLLIIVRWIVFAFSRRIGRWGSGDDTAADSHR